VVCAPMDQDRPPEKELTLWAHLGNAHGEWQRRPHGGDQSIPLCIVHQVLLFIIVLHRCVLAIARLHVTCIESENECVLCGIVSCAWNLPMCLRNVCLCGECRAACGDAERAESLPFPRHAHRIARTTESVDE
jgi:hypothetical protein